MNQLKHSAAATFRIFLNAFLVIALITLASLIGVGGAALWLYGRPLAAKPGSAHLNTDLAADGDRTLPKFAPLQGDNDLPAQLTPARYVPSESEIATVTDTPRYTYISYNGGQQQAHLRVNTVIANAVPAPLAPVTASYDNDAAPVNDRGPLTDPASHYITNAQGRVIGVDGTAGLRADASAQQSAQPLQPKGFEPEVRVAAPVIVRKAMPVDDDQTVAATNDGFSVQSELAREDDQPALRAQPVTRSTRANHPRMFGAADDLRTFGSN